MFYKTFWMISVKFISTTFWFIIVLKKHIRFIYLVLNKVYEINS